MTPPLVGQQNRPPVDGGAPVGSVPQNHMPGGAVGQRVQEGHSPASVPVQAGTPCVGNSGHTDPEGVSPTPLLTPLGPSSIQDGGHPNGDGVPPTPLIASCVRGGGEAAGIGVSVPLIPVGAGDPCMGAGCPGLWLGRPPDSETLPGSGLIGPSARTVGPRGASAGSGMLPGRPSYAGGSAGSYLGHPGELHARPPDAKLSTGSVSGNRLDPSGSGLSSSC